MAQPRVLLLRAPGTNCDHETAAAWRTAGAATEVLHVNRLFEAPRQLADYQILCIPGGFSFGDDLAAGRIFAQGLNRRLGDALGEFRAAGKLILGICNGFQVLLRSGLLFDDDPSPQPAATLAWNEHGRYEDRWVRLAVRPSECVFLRDLQTLELPIAHAEGRFVARDAATLATLDSAGRLPLRYARRDGSPEEARDYPENPNGSQAAVAGACDATGRVFGLMPHPERFVDPTHHPQWTRRTDPPPPDGLAIFKNGVEYFA